MSQENRIPVIILNGFLGSGKTTLFRNLLSQANKNAIPVHAIVNDMSELDVDGELIGEMDAKDMLDSDLASISERVLSEGINPEPKSGRQEILENYVNRFV